MDTALNRPVSDNRTINVAILGSGNIGTDLMYKLLKSPGHLRLAAFVGIDPASEGLARARTEGIDTSAEGLDYILGREDIQLVFDATSARAHVRHAPALHAAGRIAIDLTPAARGPAVVPPVNLNAYLENPDAAIDNVNLITCGGQATIPLVAALGRYLPLHYAEMVSTVASTSAGPGTRQNIDEFTSATSRGLESIGGARAGKAIMILNPATPPIMMTNTVRVVPEAPDFDEASAVRAVRAMEAEVQRYVPGYHLRADPVFETLDTPWGQRRSVTMLLEVEGAGDYLPKHAGNLDIMTAAARQVGEAFALKLLAGAAQAVRA
ncbi:acetaldehyde dehydrogenase (acetylating) [Deinococcus sp.]|uniref:acetaldehyde dehydrogenase (acetylating) n=1 Tax=Deinococcus sp. TaxID=47478 RepID=UPI003B5C2695